MNSLATIIFPRCLQVKQVEFRAIENPASSRMIPSLSTSNSAALSIIMGGFFLMGTANGQSHSVSDHQERFSGFPIPEFSQSWLDPWPHSHFSQRGVPLVHSFNLEPAFLGRDLFLTHGSTESDEGNERELEVELEWAFTRRLGIIVEAPLIQLNPDGSGSELGAGDAAAAIRALLIESPGLFLAANLEISLPLGNEDKGLGSGETGLAPSFSAWVDLGSVLQLNAQVGTEHGLESGDSELFYNGSLAYIFSTHSHPDSSQDDHGHDGAHSTFGVTSGVLEFSGRTLLDGLNDGRSTAQMLIGVSHNLSGSMEVRGGFQFPVGGNQEFDYGLILGLVHHF